MTPRKRLVQCSLSSEWGQMNSLHLFLCVYPTGRIEYYGHIRFPHSNRPKGKEGTMQVPWRALNLNGAVTIAQGPAFEKLKKSVKRRMQNPNPGRKVYNPPVLTSICPQVTGANGAKHHA